MKVLSALVRREFWEHRALWVAPLVVAALLLISVLSGHGSLHLPDDMPRHALDDNKRLAIFALTTWALTIPQYVVMLIVLFFYLLDSLYAERKDRSILFWKSLPVSDGATVLSKVLVAIVIVPLAVYLLNLVTDALFTGILRWRLRDSPLGAFLTWDTEVWLKVQSLMLVGLLVAILWYAPVAAYLLLVSSWARRNVFLWAVLPPVLLLFVEEIALDTDYVKNFLAHRLAGVYTAFGKGTGYDRVEEALESESGVPPVHHILEAVDAGAAFASADLWLGVAAAAALVWGAVRVRRYRDDT